jgi:hypothetical protein
MKIKRLFGRREKLTKGTSRAVLLSILIHAGLFLLAGVLVVFTAVKKQEHKFEPPRMIERPKMKLKKPKVKAKKTSKPKPAARIVTKMNKANLPNLQLPAMSGLGEGLAGGVEGIDLSPDFGEDTIFGSRLSIGNDFEGTFYDLKRNRRGASLSTTTPDKLLEDVRRFVSRGWAVSVFSPYYKSPNKLYATHFTTGVVPSVLGPMVFEEDTGGWLWLVHYKGELVHKEGITFRFWGAGDDILLVRVNGKLVLNACGNYRRNNNYAASIDPFWQTSEPASIEKYILGSGVYSVAGDWITLEPGVPLKMEVLIGENKGDFFTSVLLVEVQGEEYERIGRLQAPALPIFTTTDLTRDVIESVCANLVPGEAGITNKVVVFRDFDTAGNADTKSGQAEPAVPETPESAEVEDRVRTWNIADGRTIEGEYILTFGDRVVLKDSGGKQCKVQLSRLSAEDRRFIELANPPKFNIDFSRKTSKRSLSTGPYADPRWLPSIYDYIFSARLRQASAGEYNHELHVEFFAIGKEARGDNYVLLDRQESSFTPGRENGRSHEFSGNKVMLKICDWTWFADIYKGVKYGGYLVLVTDERGKVIDVGTSHNWLPGIADRLRELPLGKHFDKTGTRTYPPGYDCWY